MLSTDFQQGGGLVARNTPDTLFYVVFHAYFILHTRKTRLSLRKSIENTSKIPKNFRPAAGSDVEKEGGIFAWNSSDETLKKEVDISDPHVD